MFQWYDLTTTGAGGQILIPWPTQPQEGIYICDALCRVIYFSRPHLLLLVLLETTTPCFSSCCPPLLQNLAVQKQNPALDSRSGDKLMRLHALCKPRPAPKLSVLLYTQATATHLSSRYFALLLCHLFDHSVVVHPIYFLVLLRLLYILSACTCNFLGK